MPRLIKNKKWWVLATASTCISMILIDQTILPVALPTIQRELGMSDLGLQWLINSYLLALTVLVLSCGKIADLFGHRKIFCLGMIIFGSASLLCGLSRSEFLFIAARACQGIGAALLYPSSMSLLFESFPEKERGRAMGIYLGIGTTFLSLGPFIGGTLTEFVGWPSIFFVNVPIAALGFVLALLSAPKSKRQRMRFDLLGFFTISLGLTCIVIGLMEGQVWGWSNPWILSLFFFGALLLTLLVLKEKNVAKPIIDLSIFKKKLFSAAISCAFLMQFILMLTVFWAIYFQTVLGYSPAASGGIAFIANAPVIFSSLISGFLFDKFGPRLPIALGFLLIIAGLTWFIFFTTPSTFLILIPTFLGFGCGIPLVFTPSLTTALGQIASKARGEATGITTTLRQLGATLGMTVLGVLFLTIQDRGFSNSLASNPLTEHLDIHAFEGLLAKKPEALNTLGLLSPAEADYVYTSYRNAYIRSFVDINIAAIFSAILGLFIALLFLKKIKKQPVSPPPL